MRHVQNPFFWRLPSCPICFALATRWFAEALEHDPTIAEDRQTQHAYNAACCAALAGSGKGLVDPPPDEAARAELRSQALTWMRAEIDRWTKYLVSATPEQRQVVIRTLQHWQTDADLAAIRDPKSLAELPVVEQDDFKRLWDDLTDLLEKSKS